MERENSQAEQDLKELSRLLGLRYERQDWGIVNADGHRLLEFIDYYEGAPALSVTQKYELGELILASANEFLLTVDHSLPDVLLSFLRQHQRSLQPQIEYWSSLQDDAAEFPLAKWLIANMPHRSTD